MRAADSGCFVSAGEAAGIGIPGMSSCCALTPGLAMETEKDGESGHFAACPEVLRQSKVFHRAESKAKRPAPEVRPP